MNDKYIDKKEQIKKAAIKCFAHYGYGKTTIDDIAGAVGIKKNSLYYYYESKEQLFYETMEDEGADILKKINDAISSKKTYKEKVQTFLTVLCHTARNKSKMYSIKAHAFLEFGIVMEKADVGFVTTLHESLAKILKEGIRKKEFMKHNCEEMTHILIDNIYMLEYLMLFRLEINLLNEINEDIEREIEEHRTKTLYYLLKGIENK